jgi:hypothetical protein
LIDQIILVCKILNDPFPPNFGTNIVQFPPTSLFWHIESYHPALHFNKVHRTLSINEIHLQNYIKTSQKSRALYKSSISDDCPACSPEWPYTIPYHPLPSPSSSKLLESTKPSAAKAQPEALFSKVMATGMSAPPTCDADLMV